MSRKVMPRRFHPCDQCASMQWTPDFMEVYVCKVCGNYQSHIMFDSDYEDEEDEEE